MVESVLPKNLLNRATFSDLLRMEDAFESHPLSSKGHNWHKKSSQEYLHQLLCKLFPEEGTLLFMKFITFFKQIYLEIINILKY
jgi:hypothetical protein